MNAVPNPFRWETRIRFVDTDASGRIHYTCLFRYFESAEIEFLRSLDLGYDVRSDFALPRVHAEVDCLKFIGHDDLIMIEVALDRVGRSSIRFNFQVLKQNDLVATGSVVAVCMSLKSQSSMEIPADIRTILDAARASQQQVTDE